VEKDTELLSEDDELELEEYERLLPLELEL
jgi:hypothetical protein